MLIVNEVIIAFYFIMQMYDVLHHRVQTDFGARPAS